MHRFFSEHLLSPLVTLSGGNIVHQISHVFRMKKGDSLVFFQAGWPDCVYEISSISRQAVNCRKVSEKESIIPPSKKHLTLLQAFPNKLDKIELIVQKMVEIGVSRVIFFPSERSQMREVSLAKQERIYLIGIEALEQSGRNMPLEIEYSSDSLAVIYDQLTDFSHITGSFSGSHDLPTKLEKNIALWVWPEGGWSPGEEGFFQKKWAHLWRFNDGILRLETAAISGMGILRYTFAT